MGMIMGQADGQPGWLKPWFTFWINLQHPQATSFAYLVAALETLIALALIAGFARKLTYISAAVFSVMIWATAEGFGGPYTSGSSDIGTAVIYAVVFPGLLALSYYPARPATAPTTTWRRRSPDGGRSPRSAAPPPSRSRPPRSPRRRQLSPPLPSPRPGQPSQPSQRPEPGRAQPERPGAPRNRTPDSSI